MSTRSDTTPAGGLPVPMSHTDDTNPGRDSDYVLADAHVLILGTADWNQPIATNQHYVARELSRQQVGAITFVESMGLRRPRLSRRDGIRILKRIARVLRRGQRDEGDAWRAAPERLTVVSPLVIPLHTPPFTWVNRRLLRRTARQWIQDHGRRRLLWAYTPVTYGFEKFAHGAVYHCVDLLANVPGVNAAVVEREETRIAHEGFASVATSAVVASHLGRLGFSGTRLWENVADSETIERIASSVRDRRTGRVIFAGNLSSTKVDYSLLMQLSDAGCEVRVAGPRGEGGGKDDDQFASLLAHGVVHLGMLSLEELAKELATATVGLVPYVLNEYTRGVSPLKTFEYLAAGLAVVSTPIPGVHPIDGHVYVESTPAAFVDRVSLTAALPPGEAVSERARIARNHSWAARAGDVRDLATHVLSPRA